MTNRIFPLQAERSDPEARFLLRFGLAAACLAFALISAPQASAQLAPINPPPTFGPVPTGTGACTIGKSCAELAPAMIKSALGPSPLEENLRQLTDLFAAKAAGPAQAKRVTSWATDAMRKAGAETVRTEDFAAPGGSEDVIADVRGRETPADFVLLAARIGPGSAPETCNAAMVIDAIRVIQSSGSVPRRSIRFLFFSGDSPQAYVRAHRAELDHVVASIAFDSCEEPVNGYSLGGRKDTLASVSEALTPLRSLGVTQFTPDAKPTPANLDFVLEGIPTLTANQSLGNSAGGIRELKRHVAIAAVTAYALADSPERTGPRQSRTQVEQLLKDTGLADKLKADGIWPQWESGARGRQP